MCAEEEWVRGFRLVLGPGRAGLWRLADGWEQRLGECLTSEPRGWGWEDGGREAARACNHYMCVYMYARRAEEDAQKGGFCGWGGGEREEGRDREKQL